MDDTPRYIVVHDGAVVNIAEFNSTDGCYRLIATVKDGCLSARILVRRLNRGEAHA